MKRTLTPLILALLVLGLVSAHAKSDPATHEQIAQAKPAPAAAKAPAKVDKKAPAVKDVPKGPRVAIETSKGTIVVELDPVKAPLSVKNFLTYVKSGFYSGTVFHRVISSFMIQGGGFGTDYRKKETRDPIKLEAGNGLSNLRGTLAMARTGVRDSATSQFFINVVDNLRLDTYGGGYAVFGKVIKGMEAVDAIRYVPTRPHSNQQNAPVEPVVIIKATLLP